MKLVQTSTEPLPDKHVLMIDVAGDSAIVLNGSFISAAYEEDDREVFGLLNWTAKNLAYTLDLQLITAEVMLEENDWCDWNMDDVMNFVLREMNWEEL